MLCLSIWNKSLKFGNNGYCDLFSNNNIESNIWKMKLHHFFSGKQKINLLICRIKDNRIVIMSIIYPNAEWDHLVLDTWGE